MTTFALGPAFFVLVSALRITSGEWQLGAVIPVRAGLSPVKIAEPMNPSFELSSEYRTIELEGLLSLMCEVEIGGSIRHRGFGLGSMSFYFLLLRSYFMDEWSH